MITVTDTRLIRHSKAVLRDLYRFHPLDFIDLFLKEHTVALPSTVFHVLQDAGLLLGTPSRASAKRRVYPISGKFIVTDFPSLLERDRVFPIYLDESHFFAKALNVQQGDTVLDLCTGSGILAIFAAEKAKMVYATDINQKALSYAKFNAILNDVDDKIEFVNGDLYAPIRDCKFELIVANPPFVPAPRGAVFYMHSNGGMTGLDIAKRIIDEVQYHLKNKGTFQMLSLSLGTKTAPVEIKRYLNDTCKKSRAHITIRRLYKDSLEIVPAVVALFKGHPTFYSWVEHLQNAGLLYQHYVSLSFQRGERFRITEASAYQTPFKTYYSGCWESRLRRLSIPLI